MENSERDGNTRPPYLSPEKPVSRSQYQPGQEATVRTGHGTIDWFQIGKSLHINNGYLDIYRTTGSLEISLRQLSEFLSDSFSPSDT